MSEEIQPLRYLRPAPDKLLSPKLLHPLTKPTDEPFVIVQAHVCYADGGFAGERREGGEDDRIA